MSLPGVRLRDISIKVENNDTSSIGNISALMVEIATLLEKFIATGATAQIDLKSLPLGQHEYVMLRDTLGSGEVSARLDAIGLSEINETKYPGVWWATHHNIEGDIVADLIEITNCPAILASQPQDMKKGLQNLQAAIPSDINY